MTNPRDLVSSCVLTTAHTQQTVSGAVTGPARDLSQSDGRVNCIVVTDGINATAVTISVEESTASGGTYTAITGNVSVSAAGVTGFTFDRSKAFVRSYAAINGTTAALNAVFVAAKKTY